MIHTFPAFLLRFVLRVRPYPFYVVTGRFATIRPFKSRWPVSSQEKH